MQELEDKFVKDIVNKIIKSSNIGIKSSISQFKEFFENNLSEITNEKLIYYISRNNSAYFSK